MNEEEKEAVERIEDVFYQDLGKGINKFQKITLYEDSITDIRTVLNLIETQKAEIEDKKEKLRRVCKECNEEELKNRELQAEIQNKNKIINLMAEQLTTPINDKKWVIEYFTKLAEEEK